MSDKACERPTMQIEASTLIRRVAEPREVGDSVKAAISRAARKLSFGYGRSRDIWYSRARRIDADEMDALRREATKQAERYERIAQAMRNSDEDFYSSDISALVNAARTIRGVDSSGTGQD